jgi:hypothetical protein
VAVAVQAVEKLAEVIYLRVVQPLVVVLVEQELMELRAQSILAVAVAVAAIIQEFLVVLMEHQV